MPVSSSPVRLDAELVASARVAAKLMSRSLAQQVAHWARLGRALEASPNLTLEAIAQVLDGSGDYDALSTEEQAIVRAEWAARMEALRDALHLDRELEAGGQSYAELDASGHVVVRTPPATGR